jgi:Domain of unknown function (DUF5666)
VSISRGDNGSGNGEVRYRVGSNDSTGERNGSLSIAGRTFSIRQEGRRERPENVRVEGRVSSVSGSCPSLSMTVSGERVETSGSTDFRGGSCRNIRQGRRVEVRGERTGSGPIQAREVRIEDDDDDDDDEN